MWTLACRMSSLRLWRPSSSPLPSSSGKRSLTSSAPSLNCRKRSGAQLCIYSAVCCEFNIITIVFVLCMCVCMCDNLIRECVKFNIVMSNNVVVTNELGVCVQCSNCYCACIMSTHT